MTEVAYTRPNLYPKQEAALFHNRRFGAVEASTKSGKTQGSIAWILEKTFLGRPGQNRWWVAPVSEQARIAFTRIKSGLPLGSFTAYASPVPRIETLNGGILSFKSGDQPDCFDAETEVLTSRGWRLFSLLDKTEDVLTLNPDTLQAEWQKPKRYIAEHYNGPMYHIDAEKIDLLITPRHRFFVNARTSNIGRGAWKQGRRAPPRRDGGYYKFKRIDEMELVHDRIPSRVGWVGSDFIEATEDVCAVLGIYLAEGCAAGSFGGVSALKNGDYTVHFTQSSGIKGGIKGNVRDQMRALFARLGLHSIKETDSGFYLRSKELWRLFSKLGTCYSKFIPERIKELPPEKLKVLLHWMLLGDGTIRNRRTIEDEKVYYTVSKQLADDVQEIAIKAGYSATLREKKQPAVSIFADGRSVSPTTALFQVSILHTQFNTLASSSRSYVSEASYDGIVYCVETDNGTVLARRNGKVCWTGNSLYGEDVYDVVMDEASRTKRESWEAILSTLTATRGSVRAIGNVKGKKNWFYELCRKIENGLEPNGHYARITYLDAIAAGVIDPEVVEEERRHMSAATFRELFEAIARDDSGNPFGEDHIYACIGELSTEPPVAFGVDLAKKHDWLVVIGLDSSGTVCRFERWQGIPWRDSIRRIHSIVGEDAPALVDSTGIGDPILEELQVEHGNFRGYHFSSVSKQRLMEGLAVSIQGHELRYPDGPIKGELLSFGYNEMPTGVRYSAPDGEFDDCVCALALAREQWSTTAPATSIMEFYDIRTREARAAALVAGETEPDSIGPAFARRLKSPPSIEVVDRELIDLYATTLASYAPERHLCFGCGKPIGVTRTTDGEFSWHPECIGLRSRAA